jgi:hypothetical protein
MARSPSAFRQGDITRAVKAMAAAGQRVARVEIDKTGRIILVTGEAAHAPIEGNEWDRDLA